MMPIHKFLNRIRWDPRFREGRFEIGYYDRLKNRILLVPLEAVRIAATAPFVFEVWDDEGEIHRIPLHRIRRVYRNGRIIWERQPPREHPRNPDR